MSVERYHVKRQKPYTLTVFGFALNLFILYLLFPVDQLLQATELCFGIFLLLAFYDLYRARKRVKKTYANIEFSKGKFSIRDNLSIARSYMWSHKYYILATTIGLILALAVITQAMIVSSSYQQLAFNQYIKNDDPTVFRMRFTNLNDSSYNDWVTEFTENSSLWFKNALLKPSNPVIEGNVGFKIILSTDKDYNLDAHARAAHVQAVTTHVYNSKIFNLYSQLPSFQNFTYTNQSILILPPDITRVSVLTGLTFKYTPQDFITTNTTGNYFKILVNTEIIHGLANITSPYSFHNITYSVDRVWQLTRADLAYIKYHNLQLPPDFTFGNLYLPSGEEWSLFQQLDEAQVVGQKTPYIWGSVGFTTLLFVNLPKLIDMPLIDQIKDLDQTDRTLASVLNLFTALHPPADTDYKVAYYLETPLLTQMTSFSNRLASLQRLILLFSFPLILVSLFLFYFSLSSIEGRKERILSQLKIRGISPNQIRIILFLEVLFSAIIAALFAINLGSLLSSILMKSSGILQFNNPSVPLSYPSELNWRIPVLGVFMALSLNLPNLYKFPNVDIEESLEANVESEPFWVKHNLDFIVLLIALLFWISVFLIPLSYDAQEFLITTFGGPILIITILAVPLVTGRYFMQVVTRIVLVIKIPLDIMNMSLKNLITHKAFTAQLVAVLTAAMMLTFSGLVITSTMDHRNLALERYNTGADIVIQNIDFTNPEIQNAIQTPHVLTSTNIRDVVKRFTYLDVASQVDPAQFPAYHFFGVNTSNFGDTAYWESQYSSVDISVLMNQLGNISNGIILTSQEAKSQNLVVGDSFDYNYGFKGKQNITFQLVGTVDYFPRLVDKIELPNSDGIYSIDTMRMILSLSTLNYMIEQGLGGSLNPLDKDISLIYIRTDGTDPEQVALTINGNLVGLADYYQISVYTQEQSTVFDIIGNDPEIAEFQGKITFLTLHAILIFTVIITIMAIALYSFIFLKDRKKEFGIYRALGMTGRQITAMIFFEVLWIILISIGMGVISGIFLAFVLFRVMLGNLNFVVPPFSLVLPYSVLSQIIGMFLLMAVVLAFIPALSTTRKQTGNILRVV